MHAHVVGAGLAGLSAALRLAERGYAVQLYEAAPQAGGRCRSYFDKRLGVTLDNGNHLVLSGNRATYEYLAAIGAGDQLVGPEDANFPFYDLERGQGFTLTVNRGRLPWWLLRAATRIPGTRAPDYLRAYRLRRAGAEASVADCLPERDSLWRGFFQPLTVAALNTQPHEASARLLWRILAETFLKGGAACKPRIAKQSLAATFVEPALAKIATLGARVRFGARLRRIDCGQTAAERLFFDREVVSLGPSDLVILALPPWNLAGLLPLSDPGLEPRPIVNAHFCLPGDAPLPPEQPILGLLGGTAEWVFARGPVVSLTVSAAESLDAVSQGKLAARLWQDTARALGLSERGSNQSAMPKIRIVREKRATFAATPDAEARRPGPLTRWSNLRLAGDWTDTGLPATIEGAIRSGVKAASAKGACRTASA
ncbi:MAG: FAD-dependent oxidoreductase [Rhodospirillales bacterium]|nr:FAD-dependent oxidoreductase [Rhodospirillales bacterium]